MRYRHSTQHCKLYVLRSLKTYRVFTFITYIRHVWSCSNIWIQCSFNTYAIGWFTTYIRTQNRWDCYVIRHNTELSIIGHTHSTQHATSYVLLRRIDFSLSLHILDMSGLVLTSGYSVRSLRTPSGDLRRISERKTVDRLCHTAQHWTVLYRPHSELGYEDPQRNRERNGKKKKALINIWLKPRGERHHSSATAITARCRTRQNSAGLNTDYVATPATPRRNGKLTK